MRFSVIIPVYNYAEYLPDAVGSVLRQPGDDYEIIIVDDGSTDQSAQVAETLAEQHPEVIRFLHQENQGPGAARNHGVCNAKGDYCLFLDADDRLATDALESFRRCLISHPDIGMVVAGHVSIHPDGRRREHRPPVFSSRRRDNFVSYLRKKIGVSNGASIIARKVFEQFGFPQDIRNGEDVSVFAKIFALFDCVSTRDLVLEINKHDDSLRNRIDLILLGGDKIVEYIFDAAVMPEWSMAYRCEYQARQALSLFRSCYVAGRKEEARSYYLKALSTKPLVALQFSYLRKFLRIALAGS